MNVALGFGVLVLTVLVGASVYVLLKVVGQQGRMLLRLDHLEALVANSATGSDVPVGPPVGAALGAWSLGGVDGGEVSLSDFSGRRLVLVNWSPTCGYCDVVAPELAALEPGLEASGTTLLLVSQGDAAATCAQVERHGIHSRVVLPVSGSDPASFRRLGTPAALLLDAGGRVAAPVAVGADRVAELVRAQTREHGSARKLRGQRSVTTSRILRDGLPPGTPAPAFTLPDVHGTPVSLEDFRGRSVLLTFTDPHCGPCETLGPHLVRIHEAHGDDLTVVLVGRGEADENRAKAEAQGFPFPVVVQEGWTLSRQYGIFETPVAFLIGEDGAVAQPVARGVDEILRLVPSS